MAGFSLNMGLQKKKKKKEYLACVKGFRSKWKVFAICWEPGLVK